MTRTASVKRRSAWRRGFSDPVLIGLALAMSLLGVAMIYSAGQVDVPSIVTGIWRRQAVWLLIAVAVFYGVSRVPIRWIEWVTPWVYGGSVALLVLTLFVGTGPSVSSWIDLGPLRMQPAEFAKIGTILMLARTLSGGRPEDPGLARLWKPMAIVVVPFGLVMAQPDLGSAIVFGIILIAALFWAGVPLATIFMLVSPGVSLALGFSPIVWGSWFLALAVFLYFHRPFVGEGIAVVGANFAAGALTLPLWNRMATYQQNRVLAFLNPDVDPQGAGWHLMQSKVAIGSGGWFGQGFAEGPQKRLAFLPEQHTDFIFSVLGEELGFVGVLVFLLVFAWFLRRVLRIARRAPDRFGSLIVFCLFAVWFSHLLVNVAMTVGLMPITGLPLPFLSYGGSFLVVVFVGLGFVDRVATER